MEYPLSQPSLGQLEREYVGKALESEWISGTGPYIELFEDLLKQRTGRFDAMVVSSGTTALELVLTALGIGPGDEVIVPAFTFAAPAAAVITVGAFPVLCDVRLDDWTIDPVEVAQLITPRTKAVIAVDTMGYPCDFQRLAVFCLPVIEDAAQAHGAFTPEGPTGGFGVASIFSFHVNKAITSGEGGALVTDDPGLAGRARLIGNHGMRASRRYFHETAGRNARMTNLSAALGTAQMQRWDELIAGRNEVERWYDASIGSDQVAHRPRASRATPSCWLYCFTSPRRDAILRSARRNGIDARAVWPALSDLPFYRPHVRRPCVNASILSRSAVWLPTWSHMTRDEVNRVVDLSGLGR
jgi:perosamine synthetase